MSAAADTYTIDKISKDELVLFTTSKNLFVYMFNLSFPPVDKYTRLVLSFPIYSVG